MTETHSVVFTVLLLMGAFHCASSKVRQCEKIKIPLCQGISYNFTYMPNMFNHDTQEEAALEIHQFWPLVEINCSPDLKSFLCSMYAPTCQPNSKEEVPPCRSICERAKKGCEPLIRQYGFSWPKRMECEIFPDLGGNRSCIDPNGIVANGTLTEVQPTAAIFPTSTIAAKKCEKIKIPLCQSIGYNLTSMPNVFTHSTQEEAALEVQKFWPLLESKCSAEMKLFLCSIYAPVCQPNVTDQVPPCRSTCTRAKRGCAHLTRQYGFRWPKRMKCRNFPKAGGNISCIEMNGIVYN